MSKILKYILVFGLPAAVCGFLWILGIVLWLVIVNRNDLPKKALGENWLLTLYAVGACFLSALVMEAAFHNLWLRSKWPRLLGWAALHEICGATLFGTFLFPIYGTIFGFLLAFPLMPIQILGSISQILLFRHLHARFLAPKAS